MNYKSRMVPFMPGRRPADKERAFFAIFSTMIGAVEIAHMLPEPGQAEVLASARDFLLRQLLTSSTPGPEVSMQMPCVTAGPVLGGSFKLACGGLLF